MDLVHRRMPPLSTDEIATDLAAALNELKRNGITAFVDAASLPPLTKAYAALAKAGRIDQRAHVSPVLRSSDGR